MIESTRSEIHRTPTSWRDACVQLLGFAGTSHLLYFAVAQQPGFESSGLAGGPDLPGRLEAQGLGLALLLFALLPALLEELLFRGALFSMLERLGGARLALGGSAALFGLAHLDPLHAALAFALGLQLGMLRLVFGLSLAIAAHFAGNALAVATVAIDAPSHLPFYAAWITLPLALGASGSAWAALVQQRRSSHASVFASATALQTPPQRDE